jgi:hypothetical protein
VFNGLKIDLQPLERVSKGVKKSLQPFELHFHAVQTGIKPFEPVWNAVKNGLKLLERIFNGVQIAFQPFERISNGVKKAVQHDCRNGSDPAAPSRKTFRTSTSSNKDTTDELVAGCCEKLPLFAGFELQFHFPARVHDLNAG